MAITHDEVERVQTNSAFADVLMSIHSRTTGRFRIVKMNRDKTIPPDHTIEFAKRFSQRRFVTDVVTSSENVRGVEANT